MLPTDEEWGGGGVLLEWRRFTGMIAARTEFATRSCVYVQADSDGRPIRVGKASEGLVPRYRGGTGWALEAAAHGSGNVVFVAAVGEALAETVEATLIWTHRETLIYNNVGKRRPPVTAIDVVHAGTVPKGWGDVAEVNPSLDREVFVAGKPVTDIWAVPGLAWRAVLEKHLAGPRSHPRLRFVRRDRARFDLDNLAYPVLSVLGIEACESIWASVMAGPEEGVWVSDAPPPPPPADAFSVHLAHPSAGSVAGRPPVPELLGVAQIGVDGPLGLVLEFDAADITVGTLSYEGPTKSLIDDLAPLFGSAVVYGKSQGNDHRVKELRITRGHCVGSRGVTVSVWALDAGESGR